MVTGAGGGGKGLWVVEDQHAQRPRGLGGPGGKGGERRQIRKGPGSQVGSLAVLLKLPGVEEGRPRLSLEL